MSQNLSQQLLPAYEQGIIVRKVYDASIRKWVIMFGCRNAKQEVVMGFEYAEMEVLVRTLIGVMDSFTKEQKT